MYRRPDPNPEAENTSDNATLIHTSETVTNSPPLTKGGCTTSRRPKTTDSNRVPWPDDTVLIRRAIRGLAQLQAFETSQIEDVLVAATNWAVQTDAAHRINGDCHGCAGCLLAQAILDFWPELHEDLDGQKPHHVSQRPTRN